jgi:hypothetical protein
LSHILSFGWFSGVWILCADVSGHSFSSIFIDGLSRNSCLHIKFISRVITQKKEHNFQKTAKAWNQKFFYLYLCCDAALPSVQNT